MDKKKKEQEAKELLDKAEQEKKKKEDEIAQQQKGKEWKIKTKKRWSQKFGQGQNDKWVKEDKLVDAKNPEYMYPDLGSPWNSRYLEHDDPEPVREWWNDIHGIIQTWIILNPMMTIFLIKKTLMPWQLRQRRKKRPPSLG